MNFFISRYFNSSTSAAPLAVFRILFGLMMVISIIRFWLNGWIEKLYITPEFFFSYYGFEWVKPLGSFTYLLFITCCLSALAVAIGFKYRMATICFFLSFTYIELMDKTTYLNHYYFISLLSFLLIFLPAGNYFSLDTYRNPAKNFDKIPRWCIDCLKLLIGLVYFYAGLAKLNSDWLFRAMPLKIWLPAKYDTFLLGDLLQQEWVHYAFSWSGMLYDLSIPFLLLWKRTRFVAFILVIVFHALTRLLFPIGMFPYIMIVSALIFFDHRVHYKLLIIICHIFRISKERLKSSKVLVLKPFREKLILAIIGTFFLIQLLFPWRYLLYPGELFWTEEGYRFSWRVMLMEKAGYAQFKIIDAETGKRFYVENSNFLTPFQEKQMAFQPDFILEYAHFLADHYRKLGHRNLEVYVESHVALNGRKSTPYIDPEQNLLQYQRSFKHKTFILPFRNEIKGL